MEYFEWFELKVLFVRIKKLCEACSKLKEIFPRSKVQQSMLETILEAGDLISGFNSESDRDKQQFFINRLTDVCSNCDCKEALVCVLADDHLKGLEKKKVIKNGNLFKFATKTRAKKP